METKTLKLVKSQNCENFEKLGILVKNLKRNIKSGIIAWYWNLMVLKIIQSNKPPPLESELEGARLVEEELEEKNVHLTKATAHEGEDYTKEKMEYLKITKPLYEEISK